MGTCVHFSRALPSNSWRQTMAGWQALSRPSAAEGGGRRPAFTGLATQPYSATEVDGWQHKLSRVSQNRAAVHSATKAARPVIAAVSIDDAMEGLPRQELHDLRKQGLADVHDDSGVANPGTLAQTAICHSSRRHALSPGKPRRYW